MWKRSFPDTLQHQNDGIFNVHIIICVKPVSNNYYYYVLLYDKLENPLHGRLVWNVLVEHRQRSDIRHQIEWKEAERRVEFSSAHTNRVDNWAGINIRLVDLSLSIRFGAAGFQVDSCYLLTGQTKQTHRFTQMMFAPQ